jgi:hypothetical protein
MKLWAQYLYTAEGLKEIERVRLFKSVMRPKASADIAEARDKGFVWKCWVWCSKRSTRNAGDENCEARRSTF